MEVRYRPAPVPQQPERSLSRRTVVAAALGTSALAYAGVRTGIFGRDPTTNGAIRVVDGASSGATAAEASAAVTPDATAFANLLNRHRNMLTGAGSYNEGQAPYAALLLALDAQVTTYGKTMNVATGRTYLWNDTASGVGSANMTASFVRLRAMAIQWASPGSAHYGSTSVFQKVTQGLQFMSDNVYFATASEDNTSTNNWWDWEIGSPLAALDAIAVITQSANAPSYATLIAAIYSHVQSTGHLEGANAVWITRGRLLRAILAKDGDAFDHAVASIKARFVTVASDANGFRADYSFVEHRQSVAHPGYAYTGGYGVEAFFHLSWMTFLVGGAGGGWLAQGDWSILFNWARGAFEPLLFRGALPGAVMGRNVARNYYPDHYAGAVFLAGIALVAAVSTGSDAADLRSMFKTQVTFDTARDFFTYDATTGIGNLTMYIMSLGLRTKQDTTVASRAELDKTTVFPGMDRLAHRRPGWAYVVANCSTRIETYEAILQENVHGWYTGNGMTYFYNQYDLAHYMDGFWPTVDPKRIPGTTVDTRNRDPIELAANPGGSAIVGGVSDANCGVGMMTVNTDSGTVQAKKSWIFIGDHIVCQGSGITNTAGYPVETIVENRNIGANGTNAVQMNTVGATVLSTLDGGDQQLGSANWVHIAGVGGYVFPAGTSNLRGLRITRRGAWSDINTRSVTPTATIERRYLTLYLSHGTPTNAAYSYVFMPNASASETAAASSNGTVIRQAKTTAHFAAANLGTLQVWGAAFWQADTINIFTADAPVAVIVRQTNGNIAITVSDPTQLATGTITVRVAIPNSGIQSPAGGSGVGISVSRDASSATISFKPSELGIKGGNARVVLSQ